MHSIKQKILLFLMLFFFIGCSSPAIDQPPQIRFGKNVCDQCRMLVSEERFSASYWDQSGKAVRFDDLGCLIYYFNSHQDAQSPLWVHAYATEEWLLAEEAFFVHYKDLISPMGYGFAAFSSLQEARNLAEKHQGQILNFKTIQLRMTQKSNGG